MSRVVDWLLGRQALKAKVVQLEDRVQIRENQLIEAANTVVKLREELEKCKIVNAGLETENGLLQRMSG